MLIVGRIRTIKPEFWRSEDLGGLPEATHLLAAALLNYADDEGYFNARCALIEAELSPLREPSVKISDSLKHLVAVGYLRLGCGEDGRRYGQIIKFLDHQVINRPTPSKIKGVRILWDVCENDHTQLSEDSPPEGKGREQGIGKERTLLSSVEDVPDQKKPNGKESDLTKAFDNWNTIASELGLPIARTLTPQRAKHLKARLHEYGLKGWNEALRNLRELPFCLGESKSGWKADFDFLLQPTSFNKVLEMAYAKEDKH